MSACGYKTFFNRVLCVCMLTIKLSHALHVDRHILCTTDQKLLGISNFRDSKKGWRMISLVPPKHKINAGFWARLLTRTPNKPVFSHRLQWNYSWVGQVITPPLPPYNLRQWKITIWQLWQQLGIELQECNSFQSTGFMLLVSNEIPDCYRWEHLPVGLSRSHTHSPDVLDESNASIETKATHTGLTQTPTPPPTCPTPSENGFADRAEFQWLNMHECKAAVLVAQRLSLIGPLGPNLPSRALPKATGDETHSNHH